MGTLLGYSDNELVRARITDRQNQLARMAQSLDHPWVEADDDGACFLVERQVVGGYVWGTDRALPTSEVSTVPEENRVWLTLADMQHENDTLEQELQALLEQPTPNDVDEMIVEQLQLGSRYAGRHLREVAQNLLPASTLGIVAPGFARSRGRSPRPTRRRSTRGSPGRSSDPDEPAPPRGGDS